jgi:ABC-2 type transport system permease protein
MLKAIQERLRLLYLFTKNTYQVQTAYFFENWGSFLSTTFYMASTILFVKIIYSNVKVFAGYTEPEILLLLLISQASFYAEWSWSLNNIENLIDDVRMGYFDLLLSKPVPSLFCVTFKNIDLIDRLKDAVPNLAVIVLITDWSQIYTSWDKVLMGLAILLCGHISWHCFRFISALPVFFLGQSSQIYQLSGSLGNTHNVPLEGFPGNLRRIFISAIPSLVAGQLSASVILGKSNALSMLTISIIVTAVFLILKQFGWIISLRNYASASS